jgi:hypothetical protein
MKIKVCLVRSECALLTNAPGTSESLLLADPLKPLKLSSRSTKANQLEGTS